jgi:hypothetical protein
MIHASFRWSDRTVRIEDGLIAMPQTTAPVEPLPQNAPPSLQLACSIAAKYKFSKQTLLRTPYEKETGNFLRSYPGRARDIGETKIARTREDVASLRSS